MQAFWQGVLGFVCAMLFALLVLAAARSLYNFGYDHGVQDVIIELQRRAR